MFTTIKLGGVNGSGKTTVAREVIKLADAQPKSYKLTSGKNTDVHYGRFGGLEVVVLGKYQNACGGMDTISDKLDRLMLVKDMGQKGRIVFFEGLITGKTYGALGQLSEANVNAREGRWLYTFMDTPFDVAADRVLQRRAAAGNHAPFDPERTMRSTYDSCQRLESYLRGDAVGKVSVMEQPVHVINHKARSATAARKLLDRAVVLYHEGF